MKGSRRETQMKGCDVITKPRTGAFKIMTATTTDVNKSWADRMPYTFLMKPHLISLSCKVKGGASETVSTKLFSNLRLQSPIPSTVL